MTEYGSFTGRVDEKVPDSPSGNGFSFWRKKKFSPAPASTNLTSNTGAKKKKKESDQRSCRICYSNVFAPRWGVVDLDSGMQIRGRKNDGRWCDRAAAFPSFHGMGYAGTGTCVDFFTVFQQRLV